MLRHDLFHTLLPSGQDGEPCQNSPQPIFFTDVIRAWMDGRRARRQTALVRLSAVYLVTFSVHSRWCVFQSLFFSLTHKLPVPKLSSPHRESLPSSIRFPKNFQPVGVSYSWILQALATLAQEQTNAKIWHFAVQCMQVYYDHNISRKWLQTTLFQTTKVKLMFLELYNSEKNRVDQQIIL